jgi:hypothetical protein
MTGVRNGMEHGTEDTSSSLQNIQRPLVYPGDHATGVCTAINQHKGEIHITKDVTNVDAEYVITAN